MSHESAINNMTTTTTCRIVAKEEEGWYSLNNIVQEASEDELKVSSSFILHAKEEMLNNIYKSFHYVILEWYSLSTRRMASFFIRGWKSDSTFTAIDRVNNSYKYL